MGTTILEMTMADFFASLTDEHIRFIENQHLFFVGSAGAEGRVNVSPKGMDALRVLGPDRIVWLNFTGSGNETAAHITENGRMTLMFCSFDKQPLIMRIYGEAEQVCPRHTERWQQRMERFSHPTGTRQFFELDINTVQTSCGFGVPFFEYAGERKTLANYLERSQESLPDYWASTNTLGIDGKPTAILSDI